MYTSIPLVIDKGRGIRKEADVKSSIASFLDLLVSSPRGACSADPDFGFVLKNYRSPANGGLEDVQSPYSYKIQGKSNNGQRTFALDLKKCIERYEPRLRQVKVNMEYRQVSKMVVLTITGLVGERISEKFEHIINIHVW